MDRTTATNFTVLFMFLNLIFWSIVWEPLATTLHMRTLPQMALFQVLLFLLPAGLYLFFTKSSPKQVLRWYPISFKNGILIILLSIAIQPTIAVVSFFSSFLFRNNVSSVLSETSHISLFWLVISLALIPSVCEEIFFRGIVFYNFRNIRLKKACVLTGFYFAMMHMDLQQFLYAFLMGMIFCFLVYRTNSIFASILAHFVINASQTILGNIGSQLEAEGILPAIEMLLMPKGQFVSLGLLFLFSLPFLVGFFWIFCKSNPAVPEETDEGFPAYHPNRKCKENPYDVFFYSSIGIYVVLTVLPLFFS